MYTWRSLVDDLQTVLVMLLKLTSLIVAYTCRNVTSRWLLVQTGADTVRSIAHKTASKIPSF